MANEQTIQQILSLAKICEYLAIVKSAYENAFKGGGINERLARLIYMERMAIQNRYNLNPSDPTLIGTANYLFSILQYQGQAQTIQNNLAQSPPIITGPANQSVTVGATATFSVSIVSSLSYTLQWYLNGVLIPGATGLSYVVPNAQLIQSGGLYSVTATNSAGSVSSLQGLLTVTLALSGRFYWGDTDYSADINAGNNDVPYNGTFSIITGQPLSVQFPSGAANFKYIAVEYPATESTKTQYASPPIDSGIIPNIAFDNVKTIGAVKIIFSRSGNPFSQNTANPVIFT